VLRSWRWVNVVLGAWLVVAPFVLGSSGTARVDGILVGALVLALSLVRGGSKSRFGGGWRAIWQRKSTSAPSRP
jgi:hypothetical protein